MSDDDDVATVTRLIPAGAGNLRGMTHGLGSDRMLAVAADVVCEALIGEYPWFLEVDVVGIEQYCRIEGRARLLSQFIDETVAEYGVKGVPAYLWQAVNAADRNAMQAADALGLTPLGRMKIVKDLSVANAFANNGVKQVRDAGAALRRGQT